MKRTVVIFALLFFVILTGCGGGGSVKQTITVKSPAFKNGDFIPVKYTGFGEDVSIPLNWDSIPDKTKSIAIIMDDPDAPIGTFTHWIIFNIPANKTSLPEGIPQVGELSDGSKQGTNDFGRIGYNGPMPPAGKVHHYHIKVYALDAKLGLLSGVKAKQFLRAIKGHVLAEGEIIGLYRR